MTGISKSQKWVDEFCSIQQACQVWGLHGQEGELQPGVMEVMDGMEEEG